MGRILTGKMGNKKGHPSRTEEDYDYIEADGTIKVTCWCENKTVQVPYELYRSGSTLPCGFKKCRLMHHEHKTKVGMSQV